MNRTKIDLYKQWSDMTNAERADECLRIADPYPEGVAKDKIIKYAKQLREKIDK